MPVKFRHYYSKDSKKELQLNDQKARLKVYLQKKLSTQRLTALYNALWMKIIHK